MADRRFGACLCGQFRWTAEDAPEHFAPGITIHTACALPWDPVEPGLPDFPGPAPDQCMS